MKFISSFNIHPFLWLFSCFFLSSTPSTAQDARNLPAFAHGPSAALHITRFDSGLENTFAPAGALGYYIEKKLLRNWSLQSGLSIFYLSKTFDSGRVYVRLPPGLGLSAMPGLLHEGPIEHENINLQLPLRANFYFHKQIPLCISFGALFRYTLSATNDWTFDQFTQERLLGDIVAGPTNQMVSLDQEEFATSIIAGMGYQLERIRLDLFLQGGGIEYGFGDFNRVEGVSFAFAIQYKLN